MASQRVTLLKIGGAAGEVISRQFETWAAAKTTSYDEDGWGDDQWPAEMRQQADQLVNQLRANSTSPPIVYFIEWIDHWSMGDRFEMWFSSRKQKNLLTIDGYQYQIHGYRLPDKGRLRKRLKKSGKQQFPEYDWLIARLNEAALAWDGVVEDSILVLVREVLGGMILNEETEAALPMMPSWLEGIVEL